ncbi:MAG: ATP-binding cassette domain-containing protein, partial [Clostridiales bacterium]|nr:ATP-binding cassette domain-containing protein [Clostridiales bacterium]
MSIIRASHLGYDYIKYSDDSETGEKVSAIRDVDLDVKKGDFIAILGHNGSGKSTLAKQINALLVPTRGTMWVDDVN